jgi:hypothetical protein
MIFMKNNHKYISKWNEKKKYILVMKGFSVGEKILSCIVDLFICTELPFECQMISYFKKVIKISVTFNKSLFYDFFKIMI